MKTIYELYPGLLELGNKDKLEEKILEIRELSEKQEVHLHRFLCNLDPDVLLSPVSSGFEDYVCSDDFGFLRGLVKHKDGRIEIRKLVSEFIGKFMSGILVSSRKEYYYYDINWVGEISILKLWDIKKYDYINAKYVMRWNAEYIPITAQPIYIRDGKLRASGVKHWEDLYYVLSILLGRKYLKGKIKAEPREDIEEGRGEWKKKEEINDCGYKIERLNRSYLVDYSDIIVGVRGHLRHYKSGLVVNVRSYKRHYRKGD